MKKSVHFMGIGGSGASAIAHIAEAEGFIVTGCDKNISNEFTKGFSADQLFEGHSTEHIFQKHPPHPSPLLKGEGTTQEPSAFDSINNPSPLGRGQVFDSEVAQTRGGEGDAIDILAISPAIISLDPNNEEVKKAKELGVEVLTWQEFMGEYLEKNKVVIAVCGTHGKSTTTAMIAHVLEEAGLDPTVELGAVVNKWGRNYRVAGQRVSELAGERIGELANQRTSKTEKAQVAATNSLTRQSANSLKSIFITEADEFNNNFLVSHPYITVLTNLDMDHPEFFRDFQDYTDSFEKFLMQNKGVIVANLADQNVAEMMKWMRKHTISECLDYSKHELLLDLKVPGEHNISNAKAAFQVGLLLGIEPLKIIEALNSFSGLQRRQEVLGSVEGVKVYSDYAVHPVEIEATVKAIKGSNPGKNICVIFQPHMFSRTKGLFSQFVEAFQKLEIGGAFISDIFAAREVDNGEINAKMLVEAIEKPNIRYTPTVEEAIKTAEHYLSEKDVVIFLGAGDIDKTARNWVNNE